MSNVNDIIEKGQPIPDDVIGLDRWRLTAADCAKACCFEIRLDEMTLAYDWDAAEAEMGSKR
jgi:hypothetical protein